MISLRKHIENYCDPAVAWFLAAYRSTLSAIGENCARAIPIQSRELSQTFEEIRQPLEGTITQALLESTSERVAAELAAWADCACQRRAENERELREMIGVLAWAAQSVAERDEKYSQKLGQLQGSLRSIAGCNDMGAVRKSILETARALGACVTDMVAESRQSVERLTREVTEYRTRLEESERLSSIDVLTGLSNRREIERSLEARMGLGTRFCLVMVDLNGFKGVNDRWGHLAGDDLLRQFSGELKAQFSGGDLVGRWGGDEFVVLVGGDRTAAEARIERVRHWALGDYRVAAAGAENFKVTLNASMGLVEWDGAETGLDLLARADRQVYDGKERRSAARISEDAAQRGPVRGGNNEVRRSSAGSYRPEKAAWFRS